MTKKVWKEASGVFMINSSLFVVGVICPPTKPNTVFPGMGFPSVYCLLCVYPSELKLIVVGVVFVVVYCTALRTLLELNK